MLLVIAMMLGLASCGDDGKKISALTVTDGSIITEYTVGDTPDFSGIKAVVSYDDGTAETVTADKLTVGTVDTSTAGKKELSVKYDGFETKVEITVKPAPVPVTLSSISIVSGTVLTELYIGEVLDTASIQVEALYSDGTKKFVVSSALTIGSIDTSSVGDKTLTVSYTDGGITKSVDVTVKVSGIESITVVEGSVGKLFDVGAAIDVSALQAIVRYQNGKSETLGKDKLEVIAPSTAEMGEKNIVVKYRGAETSYKIMVRGVTEMLINAGSVKTEVKVGTALDVTTLTAKAIYNNGDEIPLSNSQLSIQNINTDTVGKKTLIVKYGSVQTTVDVNVYGVKSIALSGVASVIKVGETLSTDGASAIITYNDSNNTTENVSASALTFGSFDSSVMGAQTLSVTYLDKTAQHSVMVKGIVSIEAIGSYASEVRIGSTFSTALIEAKAIYNNGDEEDIENSLLSFSAVSTDTVGEKTVTITYGTFTDEISFTVYGVKSILVTGLAGEILVGGEYSTASAVATITYDNTAASVETVQAANLIFGTVDTAEAGEKSLSVTYLDKTVSHTVKVCGVASLKVTGVPVHVNAGEEPDLSNMKVYLVYSDSAKTEIELTEGYTTNFDDLDFNVEGLKTLTVTYGDYTAEAKIDTEPPILDSIEITGYAPKIGLGQTYNTSSVTVKAIYGNGSSRYLDNSEFTQSAVSTDTAGNVTLTVSFTEDGVTKEASVTVSVLPITSLTVSGLADKVNIGEDFNWDSVSVTVTFGEGELHRIVGKADGVTVTGYDTAVAGDQTLTVSYLGASAAVSLHVKAVSSVAIAGGSYAASVKYGGAIDTSALKIVVTYTDGTSEIKTVAGLDGVAVTTDSTITAEATATLAVSYTERGVTKSASVEITVQKITNVTVTGMPTLVNKGDTLDTSGVKVFVTYEGNLTEELSAADVEISALDTSVAGNATITVSYLGASQTLPVHVKGVSSITILAGSYDPVVRYGYAINTAGLIIEITYTNGDIEQKTVAQLGTALTVNAPNTATKDPAVTLSVSYGGKSTSVTVTVLQIETVHAINGTIPSSVLKDAVIDYDSLRITVIYKDANYETNGILYTYLVGRDDPNLTITEINTSTVGDKAILFTFVGTYQTSANVTVKGVKSIQLVEGVLESLNVDQAFTTHDIKVRVEFTDGSYIYATSEDINLILDDSAVDTSTPGTKIFKISYLGFELDVLIKVYEVTTSSDMIFGIALPDHLVARDSYKLNFKLQNEAYVVGDDNAYYFYLNVVQLDANDNLFELDGKDIESNVKVYLVEGETETELSGDALLAYVAVNAEKNSYDFTEAAIGKTFKLSIQPKNNYVGSEWRSHTVTVVDGYNVYDPKELHVMTNVDIDIDGEDIGGHNSSLDAVNNFLQTNGIAKPSTLAGIVIHANLDITPSDIPPEFLHTYTKGGVTKTELYDWIHVFNRKATAAEPNFAIYGNYYSIYSYKIPCVVEKGVMNNDDGYSNSTLIKFDTDSNLWTYDFNHEKYHTKIENLSFRDNDPNSNDQSASERHMRGVLCLRFSHQLVDVKNTNIEAYYISTSIDYDNLTVNFDNVKLYNAWQGHVFIYNYNQIQADKSSAEQQKEPFANHKNIKVNITNSLLAKCGGPVILSQNKESGFPCNKNSGVEVVADTSSEIWTYVTGQEAWFVAVNHTATAAGIKALDQLVKLSSGGAASYTTTEKIEGVSTINFMFMVMGTGTELGGTDKYNGSFVRVDENGNAVQGLNMNDPYVNAYLDGILAATGKSAPVFQSSTGAVFFTDAETGCYSIDQANNNYFADPMTGSFMGDYLALYYLGMGVMLEYFN